MEKDKAGGGGHSALGEFQDSTHHKLWLLNGGGPGSHLETGPGSETAWVPHGNRTGSRDGLGPTWKPDRVQGRPGSHLETGPGSGTAWVPLGNRTGSRNGLGPTWKPGSGDQDIPLPPKPAARILGKLAEASRRDDNTLKFTSMLQSVVHEPAAATATLGVFYKCRISSFTLDLLNQNLHFKEILRGFIRILQFQKHCLMPLCCP
ncbi:uncharacterized protein LOC122213180 [Panthera leo]|uniref:uncharacterized protein LOC122213180 n=1 Tax=Panthera leo TaxID=9689 RepID=UPI001C69A6C7|nr:uncharacterized protein LOC122213180 [Panthera leo]